MIARTSSILFSEMSPPPELEPEFNRWYDEHHIPVRMAAPGFVSAQRYRDEATRNYLAVYEMTSPGALSTPEYLRIKNEPSNLTRKMLDAVSGFTRYLGTELGRDSKDHTSASFIDAAVLYPVFFQVPTERQPEFDNWYKDEHIPILMQDERWLGVRRFDIFDGAPNRFNRLALHYLSHRSALDSEARKEARAAPWRARLAEEPWFKGHYLIFDRWGNRFQDQE
jgi:hypothetical protein